MYTNQQHCTSLLRILNYIHPLTPYLINLNQRRSKHRNLRHLRGRVIHLHRPIHQRANRQPPRKARFEREIRKEERRPILHIDVRNRHRDRQVGAGDVHDGHVLRGADGAVDAEELRAVFGGWDGFHGEGGEGFEAYDGEVWAGVWDNKLRDCRECELGCTAG
jgi:hypothetical protein